MDMPVSRRRTRGRGAEFASTRSEVGNNSPLDAVFAPQPAHSSCNYLSAGADGRVRFYRRSTVLRPPWPQGAACARVFMFAFGPRGPRCAHTLMSRPHRSSPTVRDVSVAGEVDEETRLSSRVHLRVRAAAGRAFLSPLLRCARPVQAEHCDGYSSRAMRPTALTNNN